jgi:hypothetical protein
LDYKEAFFQVVEKILDRFEEENWEGIVTEVFDIFEGLDDQKGVIEFLGSDTIHQPEVIRCTIEFLTSRALKSVEISKKPEKPKGEGSVYRD